MDVADQLAAELVGEAVTTRVECSGCRGTFVLRADGTVRAHRVENRLCAGALQPPKAYPVPPAPSTLPLPPEVAACDHYWSGWTRRPNSTEDFRRCELCLHVELQQRKPCALCGTDDARAYEVPDYGTAYVCTTCLQGADQA